MKSLLVDGRTDIVKAKGGVSKSVGIITLLPGRGVVASTVRRDPISPADFLALWEESKILGRCWAL